MDIALDGHFAQSYRMRPVVAGDKLRASGAGGELLNQCRPLLSRNRLAAKQFSKQRLVRQLRGEDGRKNQIDLIVFQFGQLAGQEGPDDVAVNPVGSTNMLDDLGGQLARTFQFGGDSFDQLRHPISIRQFAALDQRWNHASLLDNAEQARVVLKRKTLSWVVVCASPQRLTNR